MSPHLLLSFTDFEIVTAEKKETLCFFFFKQKTAYEILTQTTLAIPDLAARIGADPNLNGKVAAVIAFNNTGVVVRDLTSGVDFGPQLAVGGDANAQLQSNFYKGNTFSMPVLANGYKSPSD